MSLEDIAYVGMIVTPVLLIGGIIFAYTQWRSGQNARMSQILLDICARWDSPDMENSRCVVSSYGNDLKVRVIEVSDKNDKELCDLTMVANFFDTLGCMVVEGLLDCRKGYQLFGRAEEHYYNLYRPLLSDPDHAPYFRYFSSLHELFQKEEAAHSKTKRRRSM